MRKTRASRFAIDFASLRDWRGERPEPTPPATPLELDAWREAVKRQMHYDNRKHDPTFSGPSNEWLRTHRGLQTRGMTS